MSGKENNAETFKDRLIGLRETGEILGLHPRTIRRKVQKGEFPKPIKIGKLPRFLYSEIMRYIQILKEQRA